LLGSSESPYTLYTIPRLSALRTQRGSAIPVDTRRSFTVLTPFLRSDAREEVLAGPIRGELLGAEHLAERAQVVAGEQRVSPRRRARRRTPLLARLEQTRKILQEAHARLTAAADSGTSVGPAGEWLLDNFHVLQEHIGEVRESLPTGYYRELPVLASGPLAGFPRVYELAITLISHTEGRIDLDNVSDFVAAFQQVTALTIGELWAIPAMLRLGLIESVRRMALRSVHRLDEIEVADASAGRIINARDLGITAVESELDRFVSDPPVLTPTFISRFVQQLRQEAGGHPVLIRLEHWIAEEAMSSQEATKRTTERMAITQVVMANSITSLRAVGRMEWRTFVERESRMERVLRDDPSGFYAGMTFATRDRYRHSIERIAKRTHLSEETVAKHAIACARAGLEQDPEDQRRAHVGYYLVDEGLAELERLAGYTSPVGEAAGRWVHRHPNVVFVGGIILTTLAALAAVLWLGGVPARSAWPWVVIVALLPAADIAVSLVNQLVTSFLEPRPLSKLDLHEHGVPPEYRTAVVIPTLFPSVESVEESLENLEVQFLANREAHLHFALLGDFTDSDRETREDDAAILNAAVAGINALNARYAAGREDAFYLFHRPRRWNPVEGVWMGWERKRGKLAEFNRFVLHGNESGFSAIVGDKSLLRTVRYVITLDSDTTLPPDAAPLLVGALAHPLNRAVYDERLSRVVRGYGILQPRVGVSLPSAHRSVFAAIHSGHPGVDPYTTAVSDVYQDLYGEGSFTGKGVYDVAAFERATAGRFPENTLLSHDLIEGNYARAGLATDVIVYDDYPTRYLTYTLRKHRWIRGDWQLLPWLRGKVTGPHGRERNRLSLLARWKIVDNLRRSTAELAQLIFLIAGWTLFPGHPMRWTLLGLGAIAAPWIVSLLLALVRPPFDKSWRAYYAAVGRDLVTSIQQVALAVVFLPHQAWTSADAIVRTLWRMGVSRRHLLQWRTASQIEQGTATTAGTVWRRMWPALVVALVVLALVASRVANPEAAAPLWQYVVGVLPLILAWLTSPAIAKALAAPAVPRELRLAAAGRREMHRYALLHWRFFDRFVNEKSHWLAPDNFQEDPRPVVALRTSPTNIGLQLLATVSARELGFITLDDMAHRLELAFRTLERLRRINGHFYNWYDLADLRVLEPAYVSTVDSGNLAGHLIALRQACLELVEEPLRDARIGRGVDVALMLAEERRKQLHPTHPAGNHLRSALKLVSQFGRKAPSSSTLARVTAALREYESAIGSAGITSDVIEALTEWTSWSLRLIAGHEEWVGKSRVEGQGARVEGRGSRVDSLESRAESSALDAGRKRPTGPSLRELAKNSPAAAEVLRRLEAVAERAYQYAMEMDFRVLFDKDRKLFTIGLAATTHIPDPSYYDLLASEARLASYIAVAKNDAPVDHWFRLGRMLTYAAGKPALVSWSGSMFEYLMPMLVMRSFPSTVLAQTCRDAVLRHVAYGGERGVPWGVSESGYNVRDRHHTYQYRPFGVPDLALKRGLGRELVVAPYASLLAAMVEPERALGNLRQLEKLGALGPYGFRESLDYTRPDPEMSYALVEAFFAHHIGMSLIAMTNVLTNNSWQRRFHADPIVRSAELLLHERIPRRLMIQEAQRVRPDEAMPEADIERPAVRELDSPETAQPHIALLGHVPYTIMVSHCGAGYSRYEELAVSRWQSDGTRDFTGQFCYLKDLTTGRVWSAAHQPVCIPTSEYQALLATDRVTFHRIDGPIETSTEIAVVPEDSAEVRRITVNNNSDEPREIELTSYGEIVLAPPESDRVHPAFGNLFVETEWHDWCSAITATRRARSSKERLLWCVHVVDGGPERVGEVSCETDRARFVGRGRTTRNPLALEGVGPLSGSTGAVLDPIFALRTRVRLRPGRSASVGFTTFVATSRERAFELADRYREPYAAQRALDLAWTSSQVELREFNLTPSDAAVFQELAAILLYGSSALRPPQSELRRNRGSQQLLWAMGVSGDWPILLATIDSEEGLPTLRQVIQAHHYWRRRGMMIDLVVLNTHPPSYFQDMADRITSVVFSASDAGFIDKAGGVFVRRQDLLNEEQLRMVRATARVHVSCQGQALGKVLATALPDESLDEEQEEISPPLRIPARSDSRISRVVRRIGATLPSLLSPLSTTSETRAGPDGRAGVGVALDNGYGGLTAEGDYQIQLSDRVPPAPWSNVIANRHGGFLVTERGGGSTWAENSYFFRLTPWHNDPVSDPVGEVIYLQDVATHELWCATPGPIGGDAFTVSHAPGSSSFEHEHDGIASELRLGLAPDAAVKLSLLKLTNRGDEARRIRLTTYVEWTLGVLREHTQHQLHTRFDRDREMLLATNYFDPSFAGWTAFHRMSEPIMAYTAGRRDFIGRNRSVADPAGLIDGGNLSGITGAGIDPCAALQSIIELDPGESREIAMVLGAAATEGEAYRLAGEYRETGQVRAAIDETVAQWSKRLSVIQVKTPEPSFDAMLNRWTLYQALSCRMWGRSALYQSSGAYGFRDQLQDVLAFVYAEPALAREHIVRAAGRQFVEGDVQHWWHPHSGRGVRTKFSDDLAWLPYVVDQYVRVTGDISVLDEMAPFLTMRELGPEEHEIYDLPEISPELGSVYQHCIRALRRASTTGEHGLPLIGIGDWNDGMNRVGIHGKGESVWLAWFLAATLRAFSKHAEARGEVDVAGEFRRQADAYHDAIERHGWDGEWYRRAYFDDGSPIGSRKSEECRIDSIAQSWSVLAARQADRSAMAMKSLEKHLVREDARLIMLLTPPFDKSNKDPGYIKGYVPGVRENGAQYTHAALWAVLATALQGNGDRAFELYQMINPLTHALTPEDVETYKVEPYVVAADVYTAEGQLGRGGWTWYTGSASWMYRVGLEGILGFTKRGDTLFIEPRAPSSWPEYTIEYRYGKTLYVIVVRNEDRSTGAAVEVTVDGNPLADGGIPLVDDGARHEVSVRRVERSFAPSLRSG
jgi:cyclic beta-1,2-glucan glucanotransferase